VIFVEGNTIYDIIATNGYTIDSAQGGVILWQSGGDSPTAPVQVPFPGGIVTPGTVTANAVSATTVAADDIESSTAEISGAVTLSGLPTSDPDSAGQLWNNDGVVVVSGSGSPVALVSPGAPIVVNGSVSGTATLTGVASTQSGVTVQTYTLALDNWDDVGETSLVFPVAFTLDAPGWDTTPGLGSFTPTTYKTAITLPATSGAINGAVCNIGGV